MNYERQITPLMTPECAKVWCYFEPMTLYAMKFVSSIFYKQLRHVKYNEDMYTIMCMIVPSMFRTIIAREYVNTWTIDFKLVSASWNSRDAIDNEMLDIIFTTDDGLGWFCCQITYDPDEWREYEVPEQEIRMGYGVFEDSLNRYARDFDGSTHIKKYFKHLCEHWKYHESCSDLYIYFAQYLENTEQRERMNKFGNC